jgi:tRNA nucleotidyltransferase (CCA-adding enzyme)
LKKYKPDDKFKRYFEKHISVIDRIHEYGYKAYFIGGCVRDAVMDRTPADFDIASDAEPDEIKKMFDKVKETGIAFGTVTVKTDNSSYEITTFRKESGYSDNRKPDIVTFSKSLYDDVKRRDFTINTLAYDKNHIFDYFNSYDDIKSKVIKTVGSPERRFTEDALRILRAVRFACTLDFNIDSKTLDNIIKYSYLLKSISKERIYSELSKIINKSSSLKILFDTGIAYQIFIYPQYINQGFLKEGSFECRLTDLFYHYPDLHMIIEELKNLKTDNKTADTLLEVLKYIDNDTDESSIRKLLTLISKSSISIILEFKEQSRLFR